MICLAGRLVYCHWKIISMALCSSTHSRTMTYRFCCRIDKHIFLFNHIFYVVVVLWHQNIRFLRQSFDTRTIFHSEASQNLQHHSICMRNVKMLLHILVTCHPDDGRLSRLQFQFYPIHWVFFIATLISSCNKCFAFNSFQDVRLFRLSSFLLLSFVRVFFFFIVFVYIAYTITTWPNRSSESIPSIRWLKC